MAVEFNIDASEVVKLTAKLERLHKSALPVAVRQTLNSTAYFAKTKHIPEAFSRTFTERKPRFIESHTAYNKCKNTFKLREMRAEVGVEKGKSDSGDDLYKQEYGGTEKREYIPYKEARTGGSDAKLVRRPNYLAKIKRSKNIPKHKNQKLIRAIFKAGKGGHVVYDDTVFLIKTLRKPSRNKMFFKLRPLYFYKDQHSITLRKRPFMQPAAEAARRDMPATYYKKMQMRVEREMLR